MEDPTPVPNIEEVVLPKNGKLQIQSIWTLKQLLELYRENMLVLSDVWTVMSSTHMDIP